MVVYWWPKRLAPLHEQTKTENIDKKNKIKEFSQTNSFETFFWKYILLYKERRIASAIDEL